MLKLLMMTIRSLVFLVLASTLLALGVSLVHSTDPRPEPVWSPQWDSVCSAQWRIDGRADEHFYLIDRTSGVCKVLSLPDEERLGYVSVSPWAPRSGTAEAVGRSYRGPTESQKESFCGLARIRLPEGVIIERVKLDLLPTSRPCWVPNHPGKILFAAGDGLLYRYDLEKGNDLTNDSPADSALKAVAWKCPRPFAGSVYLEDPYWPDDPRLSHVVVVSLLTKPGENASTGGNSASIWWLMMNDDATAIEAAGPLLDSDSGKTSPAIQIMRRFPCLSVGRDGAPRLVCLSRTGRQQGFSVETAPIEIDASSGQPHVPSGTPPTIITEDFAPIPPALSGDGQVVFGVSRSTGLLVKHRVVAARGFTVGPHVAG